MMLPYFRRRYRFTGDRRSSVQIIIVYRDWILTL
jgi:hypothetical protein